MYFKNLSDHEKISLKLYKNVSSSFFLRPASITFFPVSGNAFKKAIDNSKAFVCRIHNNPPHGLFGISNTNYKPAGGLFIGASQWQKRRKNRVLSSETTI